MSVEEHKAQAPERVNCFVITVSDTRDEEEDYSGSLIKELLETNFHFIVGKQIVPDDPAKIEKLLGQATAHPKIQVIIMSGGTGISSRDQTFETISGLFEKRITGFGELFRQLSFKDIGPAAMMSRAAAGVINGRILFSIPGSQSAVKLAMSELILPELGHLVFEVQKDAGAGSDTGAGAAREGGGAPETGAAPPSAPAEG